MKLTRLMEIEVVEERKLGVYNRPGLNGIPAVVDKVLILGKALEGPVFFVVFPMAMEGEVETGEIR